MKLKAKWTAIILAAYSITSCGYWENTIIIVHSSEETARIYHQYTTDQYVNEYVDKAFDVNSWGVLFDDMLTKEKFNYIDYFPDPDKKTLKKSMDSFVVQSALEDSPYEKHVWINEVPGVQKNKLNELTTACNDYIYFDSKGVKQRRVNMPHINNISMHYVSKGEAEQLHNNNSDTMGMMQLLDLPFIKNDESHISLEFSASLYEESNTTIPWLKPDGKCMLFGNYNYTYGTTNMKTTRINYIITKTKIYQKYFEDFSSAVLNDNDAQFRDSYHLHELVPHKFVEINRQDGLMAIQEQFDETKDLLIRERTKMIDLDKTDTFINNVRSKYFADSSGYYYGVKDEEDYVYGVERSTSSWNPRWDKKNGPSYIGAQQIRESHLLNNNATSPLVNSYISQVLLRKP